VQECLDIIAKQRQIEEERRKQIEVERRKTSGYEYAYQQVEENTVQTHTQGAMEVDALTPAAGNRGVKRKREEENVGMKDSRSRRAKTRSLFSVPGSRQDAAARSLCVKNLPEDTQEPLQVFVDSGEATIELVKLTVR
jgi:hypothetical protein